MGYNADMARDDDRTAPLASAQAPPAIAVLYRDDHVVALDKPPGLLVHRTPESRDRVFLLQTAAAQLGRYLYPIHRLDRATSGLILFGLSSEAARRFHDALAAPEARKRYLALARGDAPDRFASDRPLSGKPARTCFETLARFHRSSLLRATIASGRRHQIRRHAAHLAHHLIGDTSYGKGKINRSLRERHALPRLCLHAHQLALSHPFTGEPLRLTCPLAPDLAAFFMRLDDAPTDLITRLQEPTP